MDKVKGNFSDDDFEKINSSFLADKQARQQELISVNNLIESNELKQKNKEELAKQKKLITQKFKNFDSLTYDIINSFIDYIEIGEKDNKNSIQDVVIHWNF